MKLQDLCVPVAKQMAWFVSICVMFVVFSCTTVAQTVDELSAELLPLIRSHQGEVSVSVLDLSSGLRFNYREKDVMPTASLIKLPVMIETYRQIAAGDLDQSMTLTLKATDKVPGSGILTRHFNDGFQLTLQDAIRLMIAFSDNTATNLVVDQIGLPTTSNTMATLGYPQTKLHSKVYRGDSSIFPDRSKA